VKFSEKWLRTLVDPLISTQEMCDQLTMAGLEVDAVEPAAGAFTEVVVARVESIKKHPDADKLNVCQVSDGEESLQIVCGAANVREGLHVPLAKIGAVLPGDFKIKPAKLRGVESSGMLCSEKELGLAEQADGLMELPADAPIGTGLREYLDLDDTCIELDLTPNRGDCLSITGIARELGTLNQCDVKVLSHEPYEQTIKDAFPVEIHATEACTHYVGRIIRNIDTTVATPIWMAERLRRSGVRSLGAIVDITNYVMLELGQPMHAFDLKLLHGKITVRFAKKGEKITLFDGKSIDLDANSLLIADDNSPLALAGIMGGENTGVSSDTKDIFLESAFFTPECIAGKARSFGLHTDSSHRFERGVDPHLQVQAIDRATELVLSVCGGQVGPVTECTTEAHPDSAMVIPIELRREMIQRLLGIDLEDSEVEEILHRLGMEIKSFTAGWLVMPPSFRFDIRIEADLLEELVRVHGYNNIPRSQPSYRASMHEATELETPLSIIQRTLVERGYYEAITYSFVDPEWQKLLDPDCEALALANPISSEMSVMRTTLWSGLIQAARYNLHRQQSRVRLFETGLCFRPRFGGQGQALEQIQMLSGVICGDLNPEHWGMEDRKVDFFDLKGDVEALLALGDGVGGSETTFRAELHPALHPGQCARIYRREKAIGWVGVLHPQIQQTLDIDQTLYIFELDLTSVLEASLPAFSPLSRFPEVRRDLAVVVDADVSIQALQDCVYDAASGLLQALNIFDIYTGKNVGEGRKSVAFSLILQEFSRTLTDQDVDDELEKVVSALSLKFAATLRE